MSTKQGEKPKAGYKIGISFFDALKPGKAIFLENARLKVAASSRHHEKEVQREQGGQQYIILTEAEFDQLTGGDTQRGAVKDEDRVVIAELSLTTTPELGCTRYAGASVLFILKEQSGECCCIPMPLQQVEEACRVRFTAHDSSNADFTENAKSFLNSVQWTVTAVHGPNIAHGSPRPFQPFKASAVSIEGNAEIAELPLHQLYRIETREPQGYTSDRPSVEYIYVCCDTLIKIENSFCPCGSKPTRSLVFVQQRCPGKRWQGSNVTLAGIPLTIDGNGIMHVPPDMEGLVPISCPGMTLSPSTLDLRKDSPPVITVSVSEQTAINAGSVIGQFVDHANKPFVRRPVTVLLPNGEEVETHTDDQGYFEAPQGSRVYAREDDWGSATEPVYLTGNI